MYIDTHSRVAMEHSICEYLDITIGELRTVFDSAQNVARLEYGIDGDKLNEVINGFIDLHKPNTSIDQILFFHLTRRLNTDQDSFVGINLFDLLTTDNSMSKFLKEHDVGFSNKNGHLVLFHKGDFVSLDGTNDDCLPYLRYRFGYDEWPGDFCFNGFLLKDLLYRNTYARGLSFGPEFIDKLSEFLGQPDICTDFYENSTYYCLEYCVPIEIVLFDDDETLSCAEKQKYLLNQIINRLYDYAVTGARRMFDHNNPILRLMDNDMMSIEYYVSSEEVTAEML